MDYQRELEWQHGIRCRHNMSGRACEFMRHAGSYLLVEYRPHPMDSRQVEIVDEQLVNDKFSEIAMRWSRMGERLYHELSSNSEARAHRGNIKQSLKLATGLLLSTRGPMKVCTAPKPVIEEIFESARDAVGNLAKSMDLVDEVAAERIFETTFREMCGSLRRAGCYELRFAA